jgi:hypothetical protein
MKHLKLILMVMVLLMLIYPVFSQTGEKNLLLQGEGSGTSQDPFIVPKAEFPIKVDGKLEDKEWEKALKFNLLYESWPGDNTPAPVDTECYLTYDNSNLYVGFRALDPHPKKIRAFYFERDNIWYDDFVLIFMDTFNDERRAYGLRSNPLGVQADNIKTRVRPSVEWDAIYKSAGHIYDWGYAVEMAIPFNQLRFQRTKEDQVWGINLRRLYPRDALYHIDYIKNDRNNNCFMCQFVKVKGFKNVRPGRNLEFVPALTYGRTDARSSMPSGDFQELNEDIEAGLTAIWGFTPNMTLSATVNPDFSQVEADSLQLDINEPFALFYDERRPFFVEGSEYFNTILGAVYTRTMRDPSLGFKITGKEGSNTIGAYVVRDTLTNLIFPSSQSSNSTSMEMANISTVLRYRLDFGYNYTLGLLVTDREGEDYFNRLLGIDGDFRFTRKNRLQWQFIGSSTRYPGEVALEFKQDEEAFEGTAMDLIYTHDSRKFDFSLEFKSLSSGFRADLGYMPQVNYRYGSASVSYTWIGKRGRGGKKGTFYRQLLLNGIGSYMEDQEGNLIKSKGVLQFQFDGPLQSTLIAQATACRESYANAKFDQLDFVIYGNMKPTRRLEMTFQGVFGDRIDYSNVRLGERVLLMPQIILKPGRSMRLELSHIYEQLNVDTGRVYTANITEFKGVYHFNVRTFFRAIVQYANYDFNSENYLFPIAPEKKTLFTQLLFSYEINPRTVLYLGYSDNYLGNQLFDLTQKDRSIFAKVSYALSL